MILLIDNYDSFVYNLARYFERLGQTTHVVRNDEIDAAGVQMLAPEAIVISPGPCTPNEAGNSVEIIQRFADAVPMLGVCLGHQAIAAALGGSIVVADTAMHGRTSEVFHDGRGVFQGAPNPMIACRYHSLAVERESLPDCLEVSAQTASTQIMALRHRERPLVGLQFHPESVLTDAGFDVLAGFLRLAGLTLPAETPRIDEERVAPAAEPHRLIDTPVTF